MACGAMNYVYVKGVLSEFLRWSRALPSSNGDGNAKLKKPHPDKIERNPPCASVRSLGGDRRKLVSAGGVCCVSLCLEKD